jgi:hypothetical protein
VRGTALADRNGRLVLEPQEGKVHPAKCPASERGIGDAAFEQFSHSIGQAGSDRGRDDCEREGPITEAMSFSTEVSPSQAKSTWRQGARRRGPRWVRHG